MRLEVVLSGASLAVAIAAFALAGALSLRARVEPLYAVARSVVAFIGVLWLARWTAKALDVVGEAGSDAAGAGETPGRPSSLLDGREGREDSR